MRGRETRPAVHGQDDAKVGKIYSYRGEIFTFLHKGSILDKIFHGMTLCQVLILDNILG